MNYTVRLSPHAQRSLDKLHGTTLDRMSEATRGLADNPRPSGAAKMKGRPNQWRIRVGDYRVVYRIADEIRLVTILEVGHRSDVYKK
jgi:mRNA interferase RelE/StbE